MRDLIKPDLVQVETNTDCNLRCPICPLTVLMKNRPTSHVSFDEYRTLFEASFAPPYMVIFSGFSEGLLNPDIFRMVEYEKKRRNQVLVATNGLPLSDDCIDRLLELEVDEVIISMDSIDPDVFRSIRKGTDLAPIVQGVLNLRDQIEKRKSLTRLVINAVVTQSTAPYLKGLVDFMHDNRLKEIALIKVMNMKAVRNSFFDREFLSWEEYDRLKPAGIADHARSLGIDIMRSDAAVLKNQGCHLPRRSFYISADFDVSVCPFSSFYDEHVFGNLKRQSIGEIHGSERFRRFREKFEQGGWWPVCEECACLFS